MQRVLITLLAVCFSWLIVVCLGFGLAEFAGSAILESSMYTDSSEGHDLTPTYSIPMFGTGQTHSDYFESQKREVHEQLTALSQLCDQAMFGAERLFAMLGGGDSLNSRESFQGIRNSVFAYFSLPLVHQLRELDRQSEAAKAQPVADQKFMSERMDYLLRFRDQLEKQIEGYSSISDVTLRETVQSLLAPMIGSQISGIDSEIKSLQEQMEKSAGFSAESLIASAGIVPPDVAAYERKAQAEVAGANGAPSGDPSTLHDEMKKFDSLFRAAVPKRFYVSDRDSIEGLPGSEGLL